jgi:hypothetical protein
VYGSQLTYRATCLWYVIYMISTKYHDVRVITVVQITHKWYLKIAVFPSYLTVYLLLADDLHQMTKIFWKMSSPVIIHGFTVMILKPNNNLHVGRVLLHLTQESMTGALARKQCCLFFFFFWYSNHQTLLIRTLRSENQSRFLTDNSEKSVGSTMKIVTWNVACGKLAPPSW